MDKDTPGDTTDENPMMNAIKSKAAVFAKAINKIIMSNTTLSKPKLWEPDPFNGSNPKKLQTFILQCKLNLRDQKNIFRVDKPRSNTYVTEGKHTGLF